MLRLPCLARRKKRAHVQWKTSREGVNYSTPWSITMASILKRTQTRWSPARWCAHLCSSAHIIIVSHPPLSFFFLLFFTTLTHQARRILLKGVPVWNCMVDSPALTVKMTKWAHTSNTITHSRLLPIFGTFQLHARTAVHHSEPQKHKTDAEEITAIISTLALPVAPGALLLRHVCSGLHAGEQFSPPSHALRLLTVSVFPLCVSLRWSRLSVTHPREAWMVDRRCRSDAEARGRGGGGVATRAGLEVSEVLPARRAQRLMLWSRSNRGSEEECVRVFLCAGGGKSEGANCKRHSFCCSKPAVWWFRASGG